MQGKLDKKEKNYIVALAIFVVVYSIRYFEHSMTGYNTTLFAMSYRYGFISRGMLGTIWEFLDMILPINLMTYDAVYRFTFGMTVVYDVLLFALLLLCVKKCEKADRHNLFYIIVLMSIYGFTDFLSEEMYGRLDLYLYICTFIAVMLLIVEKAEWLVVIICAFCMCMHQGFVFTNANIILVLLFYKAMSAKQGKRKKYLWLFLLCFTVASVLFLYFEFFAHANGQEIYQDVIAAAKSLSEDKKSYNQSIVSHEILGLDVYEDEIKLHEENFREIPAFILLTMPFLIIGGHFFSGIIKKTKITWHEMVSDGEKRCHFLKYLAFMAGPLTLIPQLLLKVDFGRYACITIMYYCLMIMALYAMKDDVIIQQVEDTKQAVKRVLPIPLMVLVYAMFFSPMFDVIISNAVYRLSTWLFFWQ